MVSVIILHSLVGHLACFQVFSYSKKSSMNMHVQVFLWTYAFIYCA